MSKGNQQIALLDLNTRAQEAVEIAEKALELLDEHAGGLGHLDELFTRLEAIKAALAERPVVDTPKDQNMPKIEEASYAAFQQRRGRLPDLIEEALEMYRGFMLDDDYNAQGCLDKIAEKLKSARDWYDTPAHQPATQLVEVGDAIVEAIRRYAYENSSPVLYERTELALAITKALTEGKAL